MDLVAHARCSCAFVFLFLVFLCLSWAVKGRSGEGDVCDPASPGDTCSASGTATLKAKVAPGTPSPESAEKGSEGAPPFMVDLNDKLPRETAEMPHLTCESFLNPDSFIGPLKTDGRFTIEKDALLFENIYNSKSYWYNKEARIISNIKYFFSLLEYNPGKRRAFCKGILFQHHHHIKETLLKDRRADTIMSELWKLCVFDSLYLATNTFALPVEDPDLTKLAPFVTDAFRLPFYAFIPNYVPRELRENNGREWKQWTLNEQDLARWIMACKASLLADSLSPENIVVTLQGFTERGGGVYEPSDFINSKLFLKIFLERDLLEDGMGVLLPRPANCNSVWYLWGLLCFWPFVGRG